MHCNFPKSFNSDCLAIFRLNVFQLFHGRFVETYCHNSKKSQAIALHPKFMTGTVKLKTFIWLNLKNNIFFLIFNIYAIAI